MSLGFAVGLAATLIALAIPQMVDDRSSRSALRQPVYAPEPLPTSLLVAIVDDSHNQHLWRRVLFAQANAKSPPPPGVERFPMAGESLVSPALYRDRHNPSVMARVGNIVGIIGARGLEGPSDYISYTGVTKSALAGAGAPVTSWGDFQRRPPDGQSSNLVQLELALLVGFPTVLFLRAASRLSAATRTRRLSALRLVGASRTNILRSAFLEAAFPGLIGGVIGAALYSAVNPALARSGWFGFTWYASTTALSLKTAFFCAIAVAALSGFLGMAGCRKLLDNPLQVLSGGTRAIPLALRAIPLALGLGMLVVLTVTVGDASSRPEPARLTLVAIGLGSIGVVWLIGPLSMLLGTWWLNRAPSLGLRLAVRRLQFEPGSASRLVAAVVSLILVAGLAQAVLRTIYLTSGVTNSHAAVEIAGASLSDGIERGRVAVLPAGRRATLERSIQERMPTGSPDSPQYYANAFGADIYYMTCDEFRLASRAALPDCRDGSDYLLQDGNPAVTRQLAPGVTLHLASGSLFKVPGERLAVPGLFRNELVHNDSVLVAQGSQQHEWSRNSLFRFEVASDGLENLETEVARISRSAQVSIFDQDFAKLELYRVHRGSINLGTILGLLLGLTSLVVTMVDRVSERRRAVAVLSVVGTPTSVLRRAQMLQLVIPLAAGIFPAIVVAGLSADRYVRLEGTLQRGFYTGALGWVFAMSAVGALVVVASSFVVAGQTPTSEELRQE
jgi:hypothetical protein